MNQYRCYICGYWSWTEERPPDFEDDTTHRDCAENLRDWEVYNRPWAKKIANEVAELEKLTAESGAQRNAPTADSQS